MPLALSLCPMWTSLISLMNMKSSTKRGLSPNTRSPVSPTTYEKEQKYLNKCLVDESWHKRYLEKLFKVDGRGPSVAWSAGIIRRGEWKITREEAEEYMARLPNAFVQEHRQINLGELPRRYFTLRYTRELCEKFASTRGIKDRPFYVISRASWVEIKRNLE